MEDHSRYAHRPAHLAVLRQDYISLRSLISSLPRLAKAGAVNTEAESLEAEQQADAVAAVIDRHYVPGRETHLHVAVRMGDSLAAEILMAAGADWILQNENGGSALKTDELLRLLDILVNKVKAVRRLRELLTTKLPPGTFPVKLAIPIVPTIRVIVTFTKFEELHPLEEFSTPCSSPAHFQDAKSKESGGSTSWISWKRGSRGNQSSDGDSQQFKDDVDDVDPFFIPLDYTWVDADEKKRGMKTKKEKSKNPKRQTAGARGGNWAYQTSEVVED